MSKYTIGDNLRKIRLASGKKQLEIAKVLNIEESAYSKIERGEVSINAEKLIALSNFYNKPVCDFFDGHGFTISNHSEYLQHFSELLHTIKKSIDEQQLTLNLLVEEKQTQIPGPL